jgi:hypothetical protein
MKLTLWKRQARPQDQRTRRERGTAAVTATLGLTSFLLAAGMAIDVSHMYLTGSELQNAADASAIAAASVLNGDASGLTSAINAAKDTKNKYEFAKEVANFDSWNVRFGKNIGDLTNGDGYSYWDARAIADKIRFVKVLIPNKSIAVPFAQMALGSNYVNISRSSVAGFSAGLQVLCDSIVPLSVLQDPVTKAPLDVVGNCPNNYQFTKGCTYIVRRSSNSGGNAGMVSPGNFLVLALDASRGGSDSRAGVAGSASGCIKPGDCVGTQTGVEAGPIKQGMDARFGDYASGMDATIFPPDVNVKEGITYAEYLDQWDKTQLGLWTSSSKWQAPSIGTGRVGRRIIILPVVNVDQYDNGSGRVCISHFAAFFLQRKQSGSGDLYAEYITTKVQVSDGFYAGGSSTDNQFSLPVLYK